MAKKKKKNSKVTYVLAKGGCHIMTLHSIPEVQLVEHGIKKRLVSQETHRLLKCIV